MNKDSKIYIAGHSGLIGSFLIKSLKAQGYSKLVTRTHAELDLTRQAEVESFFAEEKPEYVFLVAAKTGGVQVRLTNPVDMLADNMAISMNIIQSALQCDTKKLLYVASGLVYSACAEQPLTTDSIGAHRLGVADESYGLAKILGIRLCQYIRNQYGKNFISCIPCNTYGTVREGDTQFIPSTIMKFANAFDEVVIWGDGTPTREFMHSEDLADALIFLMNHYNSEEPINVGTNEERSIAEVVDIIKHISGFRGSVKYDITKPNGTARILMDSSRLFELGWNPKICLEEGLQNEYISYKNFLSMRR